MKRLWFVLAILALLLLPLTASAKEPCKKGDTCVTIQDGTLVIETCDRAGAFTGAGRVLRTDREGCISFVTDGDRLWLESN